MQHAEISQQRDDATVNPSNQCIKYLIFSRYEAEATTIREGFWSNATGWGDFSDATVFTAAERETAALPASAGADAKWVEAASLQPFFDDMQQRAALARIVDGPRHQFSFPVLFEIDPDTSEATGTAMPFCSTNCRDICGGTQYPGLGKAVAGMSRLDDFGFDPQCQECGGDIATLLAEQLLPRRSLVGFYRPDPSGPKSPNIVLDVSNDKVTVLEKSGLIFKIDRAEWMSRVEMEADTAALPSNPHYIPCDPDDILLEQILHQRTLALGAADRMSLTVESALAAHPCAALRQQANG